MFPGRTKSLRAITLRVIVIALTALLTLQTLASEFVIGRSFRQLEERSVQNSMQQTLRTIQNEIDALYGDTKDYAAWDPTYEFLEQRNLDYISTHVTTDALLSIRASYVAFISASGEVIYTRRQDLIEGEEQPPFAELLSFDGANAIFLQVAARNEGIRGVIVVDSQPMLIAAHPVLRSDGSGPPRGIMLLGRDLDAAELERLSTLIGYHLSLTLANHTSIDSDFDLARRLMNDNTSVVVRPLSFDNQRIAGYARIDDLRGGAGIILRIDVPRDILQYGVNASRYHLLILLLTIGALVATILILLERQVLSRIISLSTQVAQIGRSDNHRTRVAIIGNDEVAHLGNAINSMLNDLAQSEARYRQLIEISPEAIIVHDGQRIIYINPAGAHLLGYNDPSTLIGSKVTPFLPREQRHENDGATRYERDLTMPDGSTVTLELIAAPFVMDGKPMWQIVARNITERKQTEEALRKAETGQKKRVAPRVVSLPI